MEPRTLNVIKNSPKEEGLHAYDHALIDTVEQTMGPLKSREKDDHHKQGKTH